MWEEDRVVAQGNQGAKKRGVKYCCCRSGGTKAAGRVTKKKEIKNDATLNRGKTKRLGVNW